MRLDSELPGQSIYSGRQPGWQTHQLAQRTLPLPGQDSSSPPTTVPARGRTDKTTHIKHKISPAQLEITYEAQNDSNEEHKKTEKCGSNCKTCDNINTQNFIKSKSTNTQIKVTTINHEAWNCRTENCVYLISCKKCRLQYVGETKRKLQQRFNEHKRNVKNKLNIKLYQHFNEHNHNENDMEIEILQTFKHLSYFSPQQIDQIRKKPKIFGSNK
jgi:stress-induced morphogen